MTPCAAAASDEPAPTPRWRRRAGAPPRSARERVARTTAAAARSSSISSGVFTAHELPQHRRRVRDEASGNDGLQERSRRRGHAVDADPAPRPTSRGSRAASRARFAGFHVIGGTVRGAGRPHDDAARRERTCARRARAGASPVIVRRARPARAPTRRSRPAPSPRRSRSAEPRARPRRASPAARGAGSRRR